MKKLNVVFAIAFLFFTPIRTYCQFNYSDFSSISGLNLVVNAAQFENKLRITPASNGQRGAVWYQIKQDIQNGFETSFQFQLTNQSYYGADGLTFVIQNFDEGAISAYSGGSIGYYLIPNSLAIEFDTWLNTEWGDPNANHISIHCLGLLPNSVDHTYSLGSTINIPDLENGNIYTAKIVYGNNLLEVYLVDLNDPVLTVNIDISDSLELDNGKAWIGFTSSTGLSNQNHDLISWSFEPASPLNIELSAPYTEDSQFYDRTPQPLNKFLVNIRITAPTLPNPPLEDIVVEALLDGIPLTLQLNTSLVTLDSDDPPDGIIDQLPAAQTPGLNYIEFIAYSEEYTDNQIGKNLEVNITSIGGEPINITASDIVSLYFAKQGGNTFSLLRDAYDFNNPGGIPITDYAYLIGIYGPFIGPRIISYYESLTSGGRCYGYVTTSGSYFLYPERKPFLGEVHDWSYYNTFVSDKINIAFISQALYKDDLVPDVEATHQTLISDLNIYHPVSLRVGLNDTQNNFELNHSLLAVGLTTFNNVGNSYIQLYDPNHPNESHSVKLDFVNNIFGFPFGEHILDLLAAFPRAALSNWDNFNYYYQNWIADKTDFWHSLGRKFFNTACPVNILVTNSQGLQVGLLENGTYINEIPDAEVIRFPTNEAVGDSGTIISVPLDDQYHTEIYSFGSGNLIFEHFEPLDSINLFTTVSDTIPINDQTICHFDESDSTHLYVDIDGNGTIDSTVNLYYSLLNLPLPAQAGVEVNAGWNLISNPVTRDANTDSVLHLFPNTINPYVFKYDSTGYQQVYTMDNGLGFWGKFDSSGTNSIEGGLIEIDTIQVFEGWNLVGSISVSIDTSTIISLPDGLRASNWFGFNGGYNISGEIKPGHAYWVKTNADGEFVFSAVEQLGKTQTARESVLDKLNSITIADENGNSQTLYFGVDANEEIIQSSFEMPPMPPGGSFV